MQIEWHKTKGGNEAYAFIGPSAPDATDYIFVISIKQDEQGFHAYAKSGVTFFYKWYPRNASLKVIVSDLKTACIQAAQRVLMHFMEE